MWSKNLLLFIVILTIIFFTSCASILNNYYTNITVLSDRPANVTLKNESNDYSNLKTSNDIMVPRAKKPVTLIVRNDSISKDITLRSNTSFNYWLNIFTYGTGFWFDRKSEKRFAYPRKIYVKMDPLANNKITKIPRKIASPYDNIIKWTPLSLLADINPSIELTYERRISSLFSLNLASSYLLANSISEHWHNKGLQIEIEPRFYLSKTAPFGQFLGFSFGYLNKRYYDSVSFVKPIAENAPYDESNYYLYYTHIKKQSTYFRLIYGIQYRISPHWIVNGNLGFGSVENEIHYLNRPNKTDQYFDNMGPDPNIHRNINKEGIHDKATFSVGLKIGYAF